MKIVCLLLVLSIESIFAANTHSQETKISIADNQMKVADLISIIEKKTGYLFVYNKNEVDINRIISVGYKQEKLKKILHQVFDPVNIDFAVTGKGIMLKKKVSLSLAPITESIKQDDKITVTGSVSDKEGLPIIGVSVILEGAIGIGTITDIDGHYSLLVPENGVLIFSYIGYHKQIIPVKRQTNINVIMEESSQNLAEVEIVGIGYGTMRKSDLTGAITSVSQKDFKKGVITTAEQLLQGKVAGLSVVHGSGDPTAETYMRLRGGTSLAANNMPLIVIDGIPGVDFNTVQPSEILSIDILKDASATAIYGSRGANGVIIVTTNRSANNRESFTMELNAYMAVGVVAKRMDLLSASQWRDYVKQNNIDNAIDYGADTNWQKELERTAISQNYNLFMSSVHQNSGYRASFTYQENQGVIKRSNLDRIYGSVSAHQYAFDKKLKVEVGLNASKDNWNPINGIMFERAMNQNPTVPVKDKNGNYTSISGVNTENPVEINENRTADHSKFRFLGYGKIEYEIIKGLKAVVNGSFEYNSTQARFYAPTYGIFEGKAEKGKASRSLSDYTNKQIETYGTYEFGFDDIHKFNIMAGYSYLNNIYEGFGATRRGFDTDMFLYNNLGAGTDYRIGDVSSFKGEAALASFFGRLNYNYLNKYLFTATVRRDGSSRFGKNSKWGTFPSASFAWRISEESFMEDISSWLDNLKLRIGYGVTGNQDGIGEYKSLAILGANNSSYYDPVSNSWKKAYGPIQNTNPNLKWESTAQLNLGIDFNVFRKINGTIEFYYKKTSDLLWTYPVPQPPYLVATMLANVGDLSNRGLEITLDANIIKTNDFVWDTNLTFSYNKQKIDKLSNANYEISDLKSGSLHGLRGLSGIYSQVVREGYPAGTFWGPKCLGIDANGSYILNKDADGNPINEYLGSAQPKFNLGLGMNFSYKHFDLNISAYGMFGQKVLNATELSMYDQTRLPSQNVPKSYLKSGIKSDPVFSDYWVENGSFLRLQSMTLGYTISDTKKIGLQKMRFYITGENLFVITGYSGIDPEVDTNGLDAPGIVRFNYYPRPRTFSFGINVTL